MPNKIEFGKQLFELRMKRGLTLTEFGKLVGISANYAGELERGKKEASDEIIRKIANVYNVSEESLFVIMKRVPLGIKEETESSPELQELLSEIAKNKNLDDEAKKKIYQKVRKYYESLLDDI
jgi:transcriptional regulator with XRE-family HTH domain